MVRAVLSSPTRPNYLPCSIDLVTTVTVQIYINIAMGMTAAVVKTMEAYLALFKEVDVVVGLELPDVPGRVARKLIFLLTPDMVRLVSELYLANLKQMVVSSFGHIQRKILEKFDDERTAAEALVAGADLTGLREATQISLKDPYERKMLICEKISVDITASLVHELEAILLPKASKMMKQIRKHEPMPPGIKGKVTKVSKKILIEQGILGDPGALLVRMMLRTFRSKLPVFVRAIVRTKFDAIEAGLSLPNFEVELVERSGFEERPLIDDEAGSSLALPTMPLLLLCATIPDADAP